MPKNPDIKKVLVLGSGPIVIGQAAEFDYAGTQACRSLKEEGIEVVLLNSNPATIMTDKDIADRVYIEPLTLEVVEQLIKKEKPDSVLPTLGGQAGLNLAMELEEAGFLKENNVRLIGTTALTIKKAEDREMFKETMEKIGELGTLHEKSCTDNHGCLASGNAHFLSVAKLCHFPQGLAVLVADFSGFADFLIGHLTACPLFHLFPKQIDHKLIPCLMSAGPGKQPVNKCQRRKFLFRLHPVQFS